jgi:membrane protein involved in colicin uptake
MSQNYEILRQLEKERQHLSSSRRQPISLKKRSEVEQKSFADAVLEVLEGVCERRSPQQSKENLW